MMKFIALGTSKTGSRTKCFILMIVFLSFVLNGCMGFHHTDTYVEELFDQKNYEEITTRFDLDYMLSHKQFDNIYMLAYSHYQLENYQEALDIIEAVIDKTDDFNINKLKYDVLEDMGKYDEADTFLDELISTYEDKFDSIDMIDKMEYCYFLVSASKNHKAIKNYKALIESTKESRYLDPIYNNMAWAYMNLGDYENAAEYSKKSLEISPDDSITLLNLARSCSKLDRIDEAEEAYRDAYSCDHDSTIALYELGTLLEKKEDKDLDELIKLWEAYTVLEPDDSNGWTHLYDIYAEVSYEEKALATLEKIVENQPTNNYYVQLLLKHYEDNDDTKSYDNLLLDYRLETNSLELDNLLIIYAFKYKTEEEAFNLLEDFTQNHSENIWSLYNLVEELYLNDKASYFKILSVLDKNYGTEERMNVQESIYYDYDDNDSIVALAQEMMELNGESSYTYEILGDANYYKDDYSEAYKYYNKAESLGESMDYINMYMLDCEISLNMLDKAELRLNKMLKDDDSTMLYVHKARLEVLSGDVDSAIESLISAIKKSSYVMSIVDEYKELSTIKDDQKVVKVVEDLY